MNLTNDEIKALVKTDVTRLNNQGNNDIKALIELRDDMFSAVDQLSSKSGKSSEEEIRFSNSLTAKIRQLDNKIEAGKADEQRKSDNYVPYKSNEPGRFSGGRTLDKEGRIKAYKPNEKISSGSGDLSLGQFLRAAVDRPRNAVERSAIQNATGSDGIELPSFVSDELIDKLRASNPVIAAGGRTLTIDGLDGTSYVRLTGDSTAVWHAELTEESATDPTMDAVSLVPKTILSLTEVSREVLADSSNIEEALEATFVGSINDAILTATFGTSTTNGPTGLGTTVTEEEEYSNGGDPAYSNFVNANKVLFDNNVPQDTRSHLLAPDVWQTLNNAEDTTNQPKRKPFGILDIPEFVSSGVPTGVAYAGDFSNVVYGFRLNITIERFPGAAAKKFGSLWMAAARMDLAVFRPAAFVRIQEASA